MNIPRVNRQKGNEDTLTTLPTSIRWGSIRMFAFEYFKIYKTEDFTI